MLKPRLAKNEFGVTPDTFDATEVDAHGILVNSQLPNGEGTGIQVTETTVEKLPNGEVFVETKVGTLAVDEEKIAKERAKESERVAAAVSFYEQTKAQVIRIPPLLLLPFPSFSSFLPLC